MNQLQIFNNEKFGEVRSVEVNGKIYFVGSDIAKALGYVIPHKAISDHCKGVLKWNIPTNGGNQQMNIITEGDMYRLICNSQLPSAQEFENWVFDEILPSIRSTGTYTASNSQNSIAEMRVQMESLINDIVAQKVNEIEEKCANYYRPASVEKYKITQYIKNRLGIKKANEEYELVKERTLLKLNANKWEDIPVETLVNSLNVIDESIRIIKLDRPIVQTTIFDLNC